MASKITLLFLITATVTLLGASYFLLKEESSEEGFQAQPYSVNDLDINLCPGYTEWFENPQRVPTTRKRPAYIWWRRIDSTKQSDAHQTTRHSHSKRRHRQRNRAIKETHGTQINRPR